MCAAFLKFHLFFTSWPLAGVNYFVSQIANPVACNTLLPLVLQFLHYNSICCLRVLIQTHFKRLKWEMTAQTKYLRQEGICNYFIKGCQNIVTYSIWDGKFNNISSEKHIFIKFLCKSVQVASLYTDRIIFKIKGGGEEKRENPNRFASSDLLWSCLGREFCLVTSD